MLTAIIVGFHIFLVVSIVLMIQAIAEKKKLKKLEASKIQETKLETPSVTEAKLVHSEPVCEQKQAVQLVHDGLVNVVRHLTAIEGHRPEIPLSEISASTADTNGAKHCPNCNAPWDSAFDFCLKCSQSENK